LTNKAEATNVHGRVQSSETKVRVTEPVESGKKKFVEPELSVSVDILEATTFFQGLSSGGT
jgi:hypothetical protein